MPNRALGASVGTVFTRRGPFLLPEISRAQFQCGERMGLHQVWSFVMFNGHLLEGKSTPYFLQQLYRRVMCILHLQAFVSLHKSSSLKTGSYVWPTPAEHEKNGKDFGPNPVARVGFKSLSATSSLKLGI